MKIGLVKGRHEIPNVDKYLFTEIADVTNIEAIEAMADEAIKALVIDTIDWAERMCIEHTIEI